ncbi:hypothetical protein HMPREF9123_1566 [Neisseria bacilliformis ATCC BAA-1200]|uniref:Uncharacterized protein n=1 Tax=Neisseria bacilliformis ATCC BAA-1200 TaxID=888742 RepID=F2BD09_9NEIS|nr:hypothetical protein HMPREF9123_1566 [Neisseria bacilliformis ATCC BAA-1200]
MPRLHGGVCDAQKKRHAALRLYCFLKRHFNIKKRFVQCALRRAAEAA